MSRSRSGRKIPIKCDTMERYSTPRLVNHCEITHWVWGGFTQNETLQGVWIVASSCVKTYTLQPKCWLASLGSCAVLESVCCVAQSWPPHTLFCLATDLWQFLSLSIPASAAVKGRGKSCPILIGMLYEQSQMILEICQSYRPSSKNVMHRITPSSLSF